MENTITPSNNYPSTDDAQFDADAANVARRVLDDNDGENRPDIMQTFESTVALLHDPNFSEGFIEQQTSSEREHYDELIAGTRSEASKYAKGVIEEYAADIMGTSIEDGRKRGKEWGQAIQTAGAQVSETTEGKTLQEFLFDKKISEIEADPEYQEIKTAAEQAILAKRESAKSQLQELLSDLESRKSDPELISALEAWANSPNSSGDVGEDGQGYNAGIIHFIEYRGSKDKSSRFKTIEEPLTVDGFISYSKAISANLNNIGNNPDNQEEAILEDDDGNRRFYVLRSNGDMIVGFQRPDEEHPKATTIIVRQKKKDFEKNVAASESGNDKGKLNKLGEQVKRII